MSRLHFGRFQLNPAERRLLQDGRPVAIGARALDVLIALAERRPAPVSKDALLKAVWPHAVVEENNLQVQVSALRKLLGADTIATLPGRGYQFVAPVFDGDPPPGVDAGVAPAAGSRARQDADCAVGNLPARPPVLYGRERDLAVLTRMVLEQPLTTVVGSAGIGKTSVAQFVGRAVRDRFEQGAWLVELAALTDPALVVPTVARTLGLVLPARGDDTGPLVEALKGQRLLLILDNCEHVRLRVAGLAALLLHEAPGVTVLATSQAPLKLTEERLYRLPPLGVPELRAVPDAEAAERFGAVRLLIERIRALDADFRLTEENRREAISICRHLDGIPLAIELASARVPLLGLAGVEERLTHRLRLLGGGTRTAIARHRTLRAALAWSHQLLHPDEQTVFRRLGVFAGGFTVESAQEIVSDAHLDEWAVLDHLSGLVDQSLVVPDAAIPGRHRLLESTHAFALEKLEEAGETAAFRERHAAVLARRLATWIGQRDMARLRLEMNNVRGAFAWSSGPHGDPQTAVALATGSAVVLAVEGFVVEALQRLLKVEASVDERTPTAVAARYWQWVGRLGVDGRLPNTRCIEALRRAQAMFEALGDVRHCHACLRMQAETLLSVGAFDDAATALAHAERLEAANRNAADRLRRLRVASLLLDRQGQPEAALALSDEALGIATEGGIQRYVLILLADRAQLKLRLGLADDAATRFRELVERSGDNPSDGLTLCQALAGLLCAQLMLGRIGEARVTAVQALPHLQRAGLLTARSGLFARLLVSEGRPAPAARLLGASDAFHQRSGAPLDPVQQRNREATLAELQLSLQPEELSRWIAEGRAMSDIELAERLREALERSEPGR